MLSAVALAAAALAGPVAEGAPVGDGPIGTYGSVVVVSRRVGERYRLAELVNDRLRDLDAPSRGVPFDLDLGPDRHGLVTAVYSRCRREPGSALEAPGYSYRTGQGCRLYRVRVRGGKERRLLRLRPRTAATSRFLPSLWRGKLVWAETEDNRFDEGARIATPRLMLRTASGRVSRLPGGSRFFRRSDLGVEGPRGLDLRGNRLGFAWRYVSARTSCRFGTKAGVLPAAEAWGGTLGRGPALFIRSGCATSPEDLVGVDDVTATARGWETVELHQSPTGRSDLRLVTRTLGGQATSSITLGPIYTADAPVQIARSTNHQIISIEPDRVPRLHITEIP